MKSWTITFFESKDKTELNSHMVGVCIENKKTAVLESTAAQ